HNFAFALVSNTRGQIVGSDSAVSSGFIRLQDQAAVASGTVSGSFVFGMSGDSTGPAAAVGQLTFSGTTLTGTEDLNVVGAVTQGTVVGAFATGGGGRGTATLNSALYVFYMVDASTLVLLDIDSSGL